MIAFFTRHYYVVSLILVALALGLFALDFERRRPRTRELVLVAVLVALAVASRAAFFMVPQVKPVMAVVIVAGIALGARNGFTIGALTALASNFIFGQGPWTPWQMLAFGLVGCLAGALFAKNRLPRNRWLVAAVGGVATFVLYGLIVDTSSALLFTQNLNWQTAWPIYVAGVPFNAIFAASTAVFLALFGPMLEGALTRVRKKYGLR
ncbi:MAG: ECF transporter S component [Coriobacteriia bacterium]|nr:ECF transporter S component [Coriobacteriia bacterium]